MLLSCRKVELEQDAYTLQEQRDALVQTIEQLQAQLPLNRSMSLEGEPRPSNAIVSGERRRKKRRPPGTRWAARFPQACQPEEHKKQYPAQTLLMPVAWGSFRIIWKGRPATPKVWLPFLQEYERREPRS